jgi:hypothetical protein
MAAVLVHQASYQCHSSRYLGNARGVSTNPLAHMTIRLMIRTPALRVNGIDGTM